MDIRDKANSSVPIEFDIIADTNAHENRYYGIKLYGATFPDDTTGCEVAGTGKNLSGLNSAGVPYGDIIYGVFTKITLTGGVAIAFKG
ncbi:MAG: hypothetical protein K8R90_09415 [Candidatus Cloacimonetes bacterium]|nr:hypothetical protein [Candidatus Cloacimonadota bacterium]